MARLKDICTINPKSPGFQDELSVSFVPMPKVGENGEFDPSEVRTYREVKKGFTYFQNGDVLFAKITPCMENGKGAIAQSLKNGIGFGSTEFHVLRPYPEYVTSKWLFYLLDCQFFRREAEKNMTGSAGQKRVPKSFLEEYAVIVPDLNDQEKVTDVLDKICYLISLRKQQLAKLDELVRARFVEMFGDPIANPLSWNRKRFDSLCENLDNRRIPITASERNPGIYPYYGASGIVDYVDNYIFDEDILLISEDGANLIARTTPIAFSVSGKVWVNNHAHVVRFRQRCTQTYMEYYFALIDISDCITGSAQPKLNQAKLNSILVPVPNLELQNNFHVFFEKTSKQKLTIQQSLAKLEVLKKALMQEYFG